MTWILQSLHGPGTQHIWLDLARNNGRAADGTCIATIRARRTHDLMPTIESLVLGTNVSTHTFSSIRFSTRNYSQHVIHILGFNTMVSEPSASWTVSVMSKSNVWRRYCVLDWHGFSPDRLTVIIPVKDPTSTIAIWLRCTSGKTHACKREEFVPLENKISEYIRPIDMEFLSNGYKTLRYNIQ